MACIFVWDVCAELIAHTSEQLAQWAASRADLFPAVLCERMGALHSRGRAHHLSHTKRVIEEVFQKPIEEVFEEFDETPIGTGAIAQVCFIESMMKDMSLTILLGLQGDSEEGFDPTVSSFTETAGQTQGGSTSCAHERTSSISAHRLRGNQSSSSSCHEDDQQGP